MNSNNATSISMYLPDGDPDGIRTAEIGGASIIAFAFHKSLFGQVAQKYRDEISKPGVYILYGEDNLQHSVAYIGESEDVKARLSYHLSSDKNKGLKDYWLDTIILLSKDDSLTKAHVRFAEAKLIGDAGGNPLWKLANDKLVNGSKPPKATKLPIADECTMMKFIMNTHILTRALGCPLFKVTVGKQITEAAQQDQLTSDSPEFRFAGTGYDAKAIESGKNGEWIVRKQSAAKITEATTLSTGIKTIRDQLKNSGVLIESKGVLIFQDDCVFRSPSAAASAVCGSSTNGRTAWKLADGTNYAQWENVQNSSIPQPQSEMEIQSKLPI